MNLTFPPPDMLFEKVRIIISRLRKEEGPIIHSSGYLLSFLMLRNLRRPVLLCGVEKFFVRLFT
jgi:hypothetical protein